MGELTADFSFFPFNELLFVSAEFGLGVGIIILYTFYEFTKRLRNLPSRLSSTLKSFLLIFGAHCMVSYPIRNSILLFLVSIVISFVSSHFSISLFSLKLSSAARFVLIAATIIISLYYFVWVYRIEAAISRVEYVDLNGTLSEKLDTYREESNTLRGNGTFLYKYGLLLIEQFKIGVALTCLVKSLEICPTEDRYYTTIECFLLQKDYEQAEKYSKKMINVVPNRFYVRHLLKGIYLSQGKVDLAKEEALKITLLPVKVPSSQVEYIKKQALLTLYRAE